MGDFVWILNFSEDLLVGFLHYAYELVHLGLDSLSGLLKLFHDAPHVAIQILLYLVYKICIHLFQIVDRLLES